MIRYRKECFCFGVDARTYCLTSLFLVMCRWQLHALICVLLFASAFSESEFGGAKSLRKSEPRRPSKQHVLLNTFHLLQRFMQKESLAPPEADSLRALGRSYRGRKRQKKLSNCSPCSKNKQCQSGKCVAGYCSLARRAISCSGKTKEIECSACSSNGKKCNKNTRCWNGKCISIRGVQGSRKRCFPEQYNLPECAKCTHNLACSSRDCLRGKCVLSTATSRDKCFPPSRKLKECSTCNSHDECESESCWSGKCIKANDRIHSSQMRCFPSVYSNPECARCSQNRACASNNCYNGKCIAANNALASRERCFPAPKNLRECHSCTRSISCLSRLCWGGRCINRSRVAASRNKCFPYRAR